MVTTLGNIHVSMDYGKPRIHPNTPAQRLAGDEDQGAGDEDQGGHLLKPSGVEDNTLKWFE